MKQRKVLIIKHSIHKIISDDEVLAAAQAVIGGDIFYDIKEIAPIKVTLKDSYELDFYQVASQQHKLIEDLDLKEANYSGIAYFGAAPIPLAIHLGYLLEDWNTLYAFQQHHDTNEWVWEEVDSSLDVKYEQLPNDAVQISGEATLSFSTSIKIPEGSIRDVVPQSMRDVQLYVDPTGRDIITSSKALNQLANAFKASLDIISEKYSRLESLHLFAAIPVGLAFLMGTKINPTMHPSIVTYQYAQIHGGYKEVLRIQDDTDNFVDLSEDERKEVGLIRNHWNEKLLKNIKTWINTLERLEQECWFKQVLDKTINTNLLQAPYWKNLATLTQLKLKQAGIVLKEEEVFEGFSRTPDNEWRLSDSFLIGLHGAFPDQKDLDRAGRLFLLHESLHFDYHKLTTSTSQGIGNFPKTLESLDYQADVWAILHEYAYTGHYDMDEVASPRAYLLKCIDTAIKTMWSFYVPNELKEMQVRRLNRFMIWYWQYLSIEQLAASANMSQCLEILSQKPLIELSGLEIYSKNQRVFYKLRSKNNIVYEMIVYLNKSVKRFGSTSIVDISAIFEAFRVKDSDKIMSELRKIIEQ